MKTIIAIGLVATLVGLAGCDNGPSMGEVSGTVMVDGKVPAEGSSITFIPSDGSSPSAGDLIENGKYSARVPTGTSKVEIRVPRPKRGRVAAGGGGPGPGGDIIEESLPKKYNDETELTLEVKPGTNEKNWDLSTK